MESELPKFDFFAISRRLEVHHAVFYKIWEMGTPQFTTEIPTACVSFERDTGKFFNFQFNPDFWEELTEIQQNFTICHEALHILLNHGYRTRNLPIHLATKANIAQDIVINEMLIEHFDFKREDIDPDNKYCWLDTIFPGDTTIKPNECFEYYFTRMKNFDDMSGLVLVDIHDWFKNMSPQDVEEVIKELNEQLHPGDVGVLLESLKRDLKNAGKGSYTHEITLDHNKITGKRKWETIIKKWALKQVQGESRWKDQWVIPDRRLANLNRNIQLPSSLEEDIPKKNRILVYFFLDVSSSCAELAPRFWKAASSLPSDKFEKRLFTFNTRVKEVDIKNKQISVGGGTLFHILEEKIQEEIKRGQQYPKAIFVITDGYGDRITPEKPDRWYWFLTEDFTYCIPTESNKYKLDDFE